MNHAVAQLRLAAEIAENNFPINMREGKFAQARLEQEVSRDCRRAMSALEQVKLASFLGENKGPSMGALAAGGGIGLAGLLAMLVSKGKLKNPFVKSPPWVQPAPVHSTSMGIMGLSFSDEFSKLWAQNAASRIRAGLPVEPIHLKVGNTMDKARVAGRTAVEGGLGAYGGSALMALLAGLISKKVPGSIGAKGIGAMIGAGGGVGAVAGGLHGFSKAKGNAKARLGPIGKLKRLSGL